ncbi:MAG: fimbrillin family protein [Porphyromonas sp.]|nr:fimbrillin family protein [Porphyromonas sp.]
MKLKQLLLSSLGVLALTACNNTPDMPTNGFGDKPVSFKSTIASGASRATETAFEANDQIGVYMLPEVGETTENAAYITAEGGAEAVFVPKTDDDKIILPSDGSNVNFVAYHPYRSGVTQKKIKLDVTRQSDPKLLDLIYSNNLKGVNSMTPTADFKLSFRHQMSMVQFVFTTKAKERITKVISCGISGFHRKAQFNLENGEISDYEEAESVWSKISEDGYSFSAVLIPENNVEMTLYLSDEGGKKYHCNFKPMNFEKDKRYTFTLNITPEGNLEVNELGTVIEPWNDVDGGTHELRPQETEFSITPSQVTIEAASTSLITVNVALTAGVSWDASTSDTWISVSPTSGTGNGQFVVSPSPNTSNQQRSAVVRVRAGEETREFTLVQKGVSEEPAPEGVLFKEEFGNMPKGSGNKAETSEDVLKYIDTENRDKDYLYEISAANIRATKTLDGHIWLPANKDSFFQVGNISVPEGVEILVLTFDLATNKVGETGNTLEVIVGNKTQKVSCGATKTNTYESKTVEITTSELTEGKVSIKFNSTTSENTSGLRVDKIVLKKK